MLDGGAVLVFGNHDRGWGRPCLATLPEPY